jgi:hypothetical protein
MVNKELKFNITTIKIIIRRNIAGIDINQALLINLTNK